MAGRLLGGRPPSSTRRSRREQLAATSDIYRHEMPGGQYTNLFQQARALGLADRWADVRRLYAEVNQLLGDIVKVTPTSKWSATWPCFWSPTICRPRTPRREPRAGVSRIGHRSRQRSDGPTAGRVSEAG